MKKMGILSFLLFLISSLTFVYSFFNVSRENIPGGIMIFLSILVPIFGVFAASLAERSAAKVIGLIGNLVILFFSVIIPAVSMLFWNQP
ncbi:hypothetical protein [Halobacillus sp. KGW1]|uniref:hypothetical protein n=1 Tax=Halobacillus sp. KGW1 TaxID=1793726 RepID=UPI000783FF93|nr:hypothetical protein [Halobacillus sp. KGW1]